MIILLEVVNHNLHSLISKKIFKSHEKKNRVLLVYLIFSSVPGLSKYVGEWEKGRKTSVKKEREREIHKEMGRKWDQRKKNWKI